MKVTVSPACSTKRSTSFWYEAMDVLALAPLCWSLTATVLSSLIFNPAADMLDWVLDALFLIVFTVAEASLRSLPAFSRPVQRSSASSARIRRALASASKVFPDSPSPSPSCLRPALTCSYLCEAATKASPASKRSVPLQDRRSLNVTTGSSERVNYLNRWESMSNELTVSDMGQLWPLLGVQAATAPSAALSWLVAL